MEKINEQEEDTMEKINEQDALLEALQKPKELSELRTSLNSLVKKINLLNADYEPRAFKFLTEKLGGFPSIHLLEDLLKFYKEKREEILKKEIPEMFLEAEISKIETTDGQEVFIKDHYSGKIVDQELFFKWAQENGYEDTLTCDYTFSKGELEDDSKENIDKFLEGEGLSFRRKEGIHSQTLKKLIREVIEAGDELPSEDVLKVNIFQEAKIK